MEALLPHYEQELALLRRSLKAFAARYPKAAARLAITGEQSEDPHVERLLQSFALIAAGVDARVEDDYPEFTHALLETLYPQYLRPFPACSIAQFDAAALFEQLTEPVTIARGQELIGSGGQCSFRTAYDVTLAPIRVADARHGPATLAPPNARLSPDATSIVSITFASMAAAGHLGTPLPKRLRLHLHGQREIVGTIIDMLQMKRASAYVEADGTGRWVRLAGQVIAPVGFSEDETLFEQPGQTHRALNLLAEYFVFPEKFDFVDIDGEALWAAAGHCTRLTLHLPVEGIGKDSAAAQRLARLSPEHLRLFCTPIVNLFSLQAEPIKTTAERSTYPIVAKQQRARHLSSCEVHAVEAVRPAQRTQAAPHAYQPFHSLMHGSAATLGGPYWVASRSLERDEAGHEQMQLSLVGLDGQPHEQAGLQLEIDVTCTNGDAPQQLPTGTPGGDLTMEGGAVPCEIALLRRPTLSRRLPHGDGALWRLVGHLSGHPLALGKDGWDALRRLIRQYATLSAAPTRHLDAITFVRRRNVLEWIVMAPSPALVRGIEVTLAVDELVFVGTSLAALIGVLDCFLAPYAPTNSFVQLVVISKHNGAELKRCKPRPGTVALL